MDDGLVLNLTADTTTSLRLPVSKEKSRRWTDRVKAKRVLKRKLRTPKAAESAVQSHEDEESHFEDEAVSPRPLKRLHLDKQPHPVVNPADGRSKPSTQIISSLFSHNPKIDIPPSTAGPKAIYKPSNAPLTNASGFAELGLHPLLVAHLEDKMGVLKPTSIQRAAIPAFTRSPDLADRDLFIQSQTGSGKTLSFLLPIIHDLLPLSTHSYIDRSIGTLAVIIAPTRELAKQISNVLESLLKLKLRPETELEEAEDSVRYTRWLVSGLLSGGATKTHEKARLRKGIPILVATPGRLLDHLQNTSSFNVGKCRWLVLDEADLLMELGFEKTIQGIIQGLDGRRRLAVQAMKEGKSLEVGSWDWEQRRRTILCSATIRDDVQKLAGTALMNPTMITAFDDKQRSEENVSAGGGLPAGSTKFTPPSQLAQKYVVAPLKLRLVTLVALLRSVLAQNQAKEGCKVIVFLSCTDSVDFHWQLLGGTSMGGDDANGDDSDSEGGNSGGEEKVAGSDLAGEEVAMRSPLLPDTLIFRLHGSLPTPMRLESLRGFSSTKGKCHARSSVLLCTSVASRGLDLPLVRAVIQYDLPTEGGVTEYVHRVGRTARAGKGGESWSLVAPSESEWVEWVQEKMRHNLQDSSSDTQGTKVTLEGTSVEDLLAKGLGGKGSEYESRATDVQLAFERWVLRRKEHTELARKAFLSHMRAYATHPANEKHIFHVRNLHIGHLAKSFALREAPKSITGSDRKAKSRAQATDKVQSKTDRAANAIRATSSSLHLSQRAGNAEARMKEVVRTQGRMSKKGGKMMSSGIDEFQIASGATLEKLVQGHVS
ncbi:P-loop containing nucleoside triphosphate hydrolase protein [Pisolithus orientalis]|uniref:P-loop containing nucleoside triphosphate hydrolase protein n=1 Tax=Pisolithus orientalis TaxID=936130 RepID=UPI002224A944|nr:P-loop containing nucleoside triphosphate hydrolase protein [Pisolithus orientalis]KAI6032855.1 P-loop containing nucleoside triphosphate hydrolase protein [Pisolithus orientalis]